MDTNTAVISYTDEDTGTVFQWHGGAYIEVGYETPKKDIDAPAPASVFRAEDVINVWDDENDLSTFEQEAYETNYLAGAPHTAERYRRPFRTILEAFEQRCQDYLAEQASEEAE